VAVERQMKRNNVGCCSQIFSGITVCCSAVRASIMMLQHHLSLPHKSCKQAPNVKGSDPSAIEVFNPVNKLFSLFFLTSFSISIYFFFGEVATPLLPLSIAVSSLLLACLPHVIVATLCCSYLCRKRNLLK